MSKIYIAGPMSGLPGFNRAAFHAAELALINSGHVVLNPARLPHGLTEPQYMQIAIAMLQVCDTILLLDGWQQSQGARAEHALAEKLGLQITYQ